MSPEQVSKNIHHCIESIAALAFCQVISPIDAKKAACYRCQAHVEAYLLGANNPNGSVPSLLQNYPELAAAYLDGQDESERADFSIEWVGAWAHLNPNYLARPVVGKVDKLIFAGIEFKGAKDIPRITWGDSASTKSDAMRVAMSYLTSLEQR